MAGDPSSRKASASPPPAPSSAPPKMKTKRFVGASPSAPAKSTRRGSSSPPPRPAPSSAPPRSKIPGRRRPPSPLPRRLAPAPRLSSYVPPLQTIGHKEKSRKLEVSDEEARIRRLQFRCFFKRKGMRYLFMQQANFDQLLKLDSYPHDTLLAELRSSEIVSAKKDEKGLEVVALDGQGKKFKVSIVISCGRICLSGEEWPELVASNWAEGRTQIEFFCDRVDSQLELGILFF